MVERAAVTDAARAGWSMPPLRHPALAPLRAFVQGDAHPDHAVLNAWARAQGLGLRDGRPLQFVIPGAGRMRAIDYERRIVERGEITTRPGSRHDLFNALAWLAFPRTKLALSELHVGAAAAQGENRRGAVRDAATLLDEHGAVAITDAPELFALWRAHAWRELFEERRAAVARHLRIAVMGHGLLVKLLAPYPALTAKVLLVHTSLPRAGGGDDAAAVLDPIAARSLELRGSSFSPADLVPLPVSAWPDWDPANAGPRRFDDARVFRPAPVR